MNNPLGLTLLLGTLFALTPLCNDAFLPTMPAIAQAFGGSARGVQQAMTTFMAGVAAGQLFWGPLSDRYGRRPALLTGLAVFLAASVACAFAQSVPAVVLLRLAQGFGASCGAVIARAVTRDLFAHEEAARLLARMAVVFGLAPIIAPLVAGALLLIGWRAIFWFLALVAVAVMATAARGLRETAPAIGSPVHPLELARRYGALLRDRAFLLPMAALLSAQSGISAFVAASAFIVVQGMGLDARAFAVLFAAVMVGNISGAIFSSRLVMRRGMAWLVRFGSVVACVAALPLAALAWAGVNHWAALAVPMFVYMFAASIMIPNATAAALSPFARIAGTAAALLGCLQFGVGAVLAALLALLFDGTARPLASVVTLGALGALAFGRVFLPGKR